MVWPKSPALSVGTCGHSSSPKAVVESHKVPQGDHITVTRSKELLRLRRHLFHCGLGLTDGRHIC